MAKTIPQNLDEFTDLVMHTELTHVEVLFIESSDNERLHLDRD